MASISGWQCKLEARVTDHHWCIKWQWCCGGVLQSLSDNVWSSDLRTTLNASQALLLRSHLTLVRIPTITLAPTEEDRVNQSISRASSYRELVPENQLFRTELERTASPYKKSLFSVKSHCEFRMTITLQLLPHCCFLCTNMILPIKVTSVTDAPIWWCMRGRRLNIRDHKVFVMYISH